MIFLILFFVFPKGADHLIIWITLGVFYINFIPTFFSAKRNQYGKRTFVKIDSFFMLFYYIIYFLPYQLYILGYSDLSVEKWGISSNISYTNSAVIMSAIGLILFSLGYRSIKENKEITVYTVSPKYIKKFSYLIGFLLLIILFLFVKTGLSVFSGTYKGSSTGGITSDAIFGLVTYFVLLAYLCSFVQFLIYRRLSFFSKLLLIIAGCWSLALLIIGDRNTFFIISIVIFGSIFTYLYNLNKKILLLCFFSALLLYQVIEISRVAENRSMESLGKAFQEINLQKKGIDISSFKITTTGVRTTFKMFPEEEEFYYGKFKLLSLATLIPYSSRLIVSGNDRLTNTAYVLNEEMLGRWASWGVGTNIISDAYIDFGIPGVIIILFLLGRFGGYVNAKNEQKINSPLWVFIYCLTLGFYSELPRYGLDFPLRSIIWTFILFFVFEKVFKNTRNIILKHHNKNLINQ